MQLINKTTNRGDTLIEVMFAMAIFSLVAVGGLSIMNKGVATAQRALEITQVKGQIDAQAETLRFLNSSYISAFSSGATNVLNTPAKEWSDMITYIDSSSHLSATSFGDGKSCQSYLTTATTHKSIFIFDTQNAKFIRKNIIPFNLATSSAQIKYSGAVVSSTEGLWIEAIRQKNTFAPATQKNADYIDFHIQACWDAPGSTVPVTLATVVRLYEPTK